MDTITRSTQGDAVGANAVNGERPQVQPVSEADARLAALIDSFVQSSDAAVQRFDADVESEVLSPLRSICELLQKGHMGARGSLPEEDETPQDTWLGIRTYRASVHADVVRPLLLFLDESQLIDRPGELHGRLVANISRTGAALPANVSVPSPDHLFEQSDDDGGVGRMAKAWRRFGRSARRLLAPGDGESVQRSVGLRALAAFHLRQRIQPAVRTLEKAIIDSVLSCVSELEKGVSEWTQSILSLEADYDRSSYHHPEHLEWPAQRIDPPAGADNGARTEDVGPSTDQDSSAPTLDASPDLAAEPSPLVKLVLLTDEFDVRLMAALEPLLSTEGRPALSISADGLMADVRLAGTGLEKKRRGPEFDEKEAVKHARYELTGRWLSQARDRISLSESLLGFRALLLNLEESLITRMALGSLGSLFQSFREIQQRFGVATEAVAEACDNASTASDTERLRDTLAKIETELSERMETAFRAMPGIIAADRDIIDPGETEWGQIQTNVEKLPNTLEIHPLGGDVRLAETSARRVSLATVVGDVMMSSLPDRLREHARPLQKQIVKGLNDAENVIQVVQFNFDTALGELEAVHDDEKEGVVDVEANETKHDAAVRAARELTLDGLVRASDTIDETLLAFREPWERFLNSVFDAFHGDWKSISRRTRSDEAMHGQWQSYVTRASRRIERRSRNLRESWRDFIERLGRIRRIGERRAKALIRRGQSAVGVIDRVDEDRAHTIEAITNASSIHQELPLVYRKLFAFEPVAEPTLLEGRSRDLVSARTHYGHWQERRTDGILILESPLGSGRTSFLNVLGTRVFENARVCRVTLKTRVYTEEEFVQILVASWGEELADESVKSLDDVEAFIAGRRDETPFVFVVDNLEHLMLRAQGGTALLEKVLVFMTHTDVAAYWIATIGKEAWHYLDRASGLASSFASAHSLSPVDRDALEALIVNRHRRSGLTLRFANPDRTGKTLRGRFGRPLTPEEIQSKLRSQYFDALHKASGQDIMLALFYWIKSSDFATEDGVLVVNPVRPMSFNFLSNLDAQPAFTLKAFLVHNTLTIEEHSRIFRLSESKTIFVLEALLNLSLIEPVNGETKRDAADRICADVAYRIRPLVIHPITEFLRRRHIIY